MPATAATTAPPVVVFNMLPLAILEIAKLVVVACEVVAKRPVKFCRVDEPVARRLVRVARPVLETLNNVVVAKAAVDEPIENAVVLALLGVSNIEESA